MGSAPAPTSRVDSTLTPLPRNEISWLPGSSSNGPSTSPTPAPAATGRPSTVTSTVAPGTACTTLTRAGDGAGTSAPAGAPATSGRHAAASTAESRRIPTTPPWPHHDVVPDGTPTLT